MTLIEKYGLKWENEPTIEDLEKAFPNLREGAEERKKFIEGNFGKIAFESYLDGVKWPLLRMAKMEDFIGQTELNQLSKVPDDLNDCLVLKYESFTREFDIFYVVTKKEKENKWKNDEKFKRQMSEWMPEYFLVDIFDKKKAQNDLINKLSLIAYDAYGELALTKFKQGLMQELTKRLLEKCKT